MDPGAALFAAVPRQQPDRREQAPPRLGLRGFPQRHAAPAALPPAQISRVLLARVLLAQCLDLQRAQFGLRAVRMAQTAVY